MGQITQVNPEALNVASQMILKEIDLTGTDAERKAKLDQFEKDWKALTGSDTLEGARFVGMLNPTKSSTTYCALSYSTGFSRYEGISSDADDVPYKVLVNIDDGSLTITPLFQHLEAVVLRISDGDSNADTVNAANKTSIENYVANLQSLGVSIEDTPCHFRLLKYKNGNYTNYAVNVGILKLTEKYGQYDFWIDGVKGSVDYDTGKVTISFNLNTILKAIRHGFEAITIYTDNTDEHMQANLDNIAAYEANLQALRVDVTKGFLIPVYIDGNGLGFLCKPGDVIYYMGVMNYYGSSSFGISIDAMGTYYSYKLQTETNNSLTTTSKQIVGAINEVNALAKGVKALGAIELKAEDKAANKTALAAFLKILTDAGIDTANGYSTPIRITGNSQEYFGTLNIGTGTLLSGVVTDINESHHYPCNVNITDGELTFSETNYFLEKTSNEVVEMLDAIKYSHTPVPFTETTLSNKAQLEVFLSKVPDAQVMHCTYKGVYAGTLHKINGDWFGLLVKNTNDYADNLNVKLQADGTLIEGTTSVQSINEQLDAINGEVK